MKKDDNGSYPTSAVILTYEKGKAPTEVRMIYLTFKTRPYVRAPVRCYNCHIYGHVAKHCLRQTRCAGCVGEHATKDCPNPQIEPKNCASCDSKNHTTGSKLCPMRVRASVINSTMAKEGISYAQAAKKLDSNHSIAQGPPKANSLPAVIEYGSLSLNAQKGVPRPIPENNDQSTKIASSVSEIIDSKLKIIKDDIRHIAERILRLTDSLYGKVDPTGESEESDGPQLSNNTVSTQTVPLQETESDVLEPSLVQLIVNIKKLANRLTPTSASKTDSSSSTQDKRRKLIARELVSVVDFLTTILDKIAPTEDQAHPKGAKPSNR